MATLVERASPLEFYGKRLKRLLPAYLTVIFFVTLAVILLTFPVDANQRIDRLFYDLVALSNFSFWAENSYFNSSAFKPLLNLWSLAVEFQFYLLAPFLLPFLHRRKVVLFLLTLGSLLASMALLTISPKTSFFMLPTRFWEFLFGAYAAWFLVNKSETKAALLLPLFAVISVVSVIAFYPLPIDSLNILTGHPSLAALIVAASTAIILAIGLDGLIPIDSIVSRMLIKIGDYSYSIYLTHFPIIVLINYSAFGGTKLGFENITDLITIIVVTVVASYLLYNYVEKIRYTKNVARPVLGLVIICLVLGLIGSKLNGLKFSKDEILIFNAWKDRSTYRCGKMSRILNPTSKICMLGEELDGSRVLLLGNSHADSIKTAFQSAMNEHGNTTFFYVANNPLMSVSQNEEVVKNEIIHNSITSVVVHYSASFYTNSVLLQRMHNFIKFLKQNNVKIFFIAPVPFYDFHVPKKMLEVLNNSNLNFPIQNYSKYKVDNVGFFEFINVNNISEKDIWYPHSIFCPEGKCRYQKSGAPYYFDGGHLTLTGARELLPLFSEIGAKLNLGY